MHELTKSYKSNKGKYDDFGKKAESLVKELLTQNSVVCHNINCRVKSVDRLAEKIIRKDDKYESLDNVTDLVGIRIITYFEDEVDIIADIISREFLVDVSNSLDKRKLDSDRFGYRSLHYVVQLSAERQLLTEYKRFQDIKVEIQIRSILQHAWAEIEHDKGYKSETSIPDVVKRSFYRVAALLETADIEFVNIKKQLKIYAETIGSKIDQKLEVVEIDAVTLKYFIENNQLVSLIDNAIFAQSALTQQDKVFDCENLVEKLHFLKISTIAELQNALNLNSEIIPHFANNWVGRVSYTVPVPKGISIFYLCYVLVAVKNDIRYEMEYLFNFSLTRKTDNRSLIDTYNSTLSKLSPSA